MTSPTWSPGRRAACGVAAAGLLLAFGGASHPRVDTAVAFEEGLAGMFESSAWTASHALTMAGFVVLAASLAVLVRVAGAAWTPRLRAIGVLAAAAAGFAALESVPHLLAATDLDALRRGDATPLADLHTALQAFSAPAVGLSLAVLAFAGASSGVLDGGRIATALAVLGGVAFALAGPAIAITQNSELSPLFAGSAGLAIWAIAAGIRTARRETGARGPDRRREPATAAGSAR